MSSESIALRIVEQGARPVGERLHDWIVTVDHKKLGILYILYALLFIVVGGIEAAIMRIQLIVPHNHFVSPEVFNRMFTMHGTTMIFFVAMPMVFGFGTYLIPLMIGARDMAFPRLNALSFWLTAFGGLLLYFSFIGGNGLYGAGNAPDVGWFAYAPLTSRAFSPGHSTDFWTLALLVSGIGSIGTAINFVATILCMRCPGMSLGKMPLLAWMNLVMGGMVILAVSPLTAAQIMLSVDRYLGGHFFDTQAGGSAVLWMHFFWIFGHPEVYVLVIPAFAFASEIIPGIFPQADFRLSGDGGGHRGNRISEPERLGAPHVHRGNVVVCQQLFHDHHDGRGCSHRDQNLQLDWDDVGWKDSVQSSHALLHRFSVPVSDCRFDGNHAGRISLQLATQRVLLCGCAFSLRDRGRNSFYDFRSLLLLVPENERADVQRDAAKWHFWLFLIGFHLTFDFMHIPGMLGMPRRIYTYEPGRGWDIWNLIVTIGVFFQIAAVLVFVGNLLLVIREGQTRRE